MTQRRVLFMLVVWLNAAAAAAAHAQTPAPTVQPAPAPAPPAPPAAPKQPEEPSRGQLSNIRVEVTIVDQRAAGTPLKKTVSAVVADGFRAGIRSSATVVGLPQAIPLNVDIAPRIVGDKVRVNVGLEYDLPASEPIQPSRETLGRVVRTEIRENVTLLLESGKPVVAAQSADPIDDRQVTIEVRATILK